tara:strand:- start:260 stop:1312 length:1053 start_codon:yes stop_codon:yes gene_type:complete
MNYKFFNYPKPLTLEDYKISREKLIEFFSQSNDLRGIFEYGSTNNLGISDLDIIIVLKNKISKNASSFFSKNNLPKKTLIALDYASLIILPEYDFDKILMWDNLKLNQIYGDKIKFINFDSFELNIARIIDWLPERIVRIEECLSTPNINVRKSLGLLKSSCYTLKNLKKDFNITNELLEKNILEVDKLRSNWFNIKSIEREKLLIKQLNISKKNLLSSMKKFNIFLCNNFNLKELGKDKNISLNFVNKFAFSYKNNSRNNYLKKYNSGCIELVIPYFYMMHFIKYSNEVGLISDNIRKNITCEPIHNEFKLPEKYNLLLKNRINLCNEWASYLKFNNFNTGLFKMAWFF